MRFWVGSGIDTTCSSCGVSRSAHERKCERDLIFGSSAIATNILPVATEYTLHIDVNKSCSICWVSHDILELLWQRVDDVCFS